MTDESLPFPDDLPRDPAMVEDAGIAFDEAVVATPTPNPWRRAFRRLLRDKPAVVALAFLLLVLFAAVFAPFVAPHPPNEIRVAPPFSGPSWDTPFGTDSLGRDTFSRIIYGARVSLSSGFEIVFLALLAAVPIGLLAGFRGGGTDNILMRVMDALASFPPLVLALAVVGILGPGLENAVLAIAIVVIPGFARLVRAQTLAVRQETFIEASRSMGTKPGRVRRTRVLPNVASPLIVAVSLAMGAALIAEAGLSLLGFGVLPPKPSWGSMIQQGRTFIYQHPWQVFVPSIALALTILAFNTFGDGLRDALGLGLPKGKQKIKGRLGLTTVDRQPPNGAASPAPTPTATPGARRRRADAGGERRAAERVVTVGAVPHRCGPGHRRRQRQLQRAPGRDARHRRRVRFGQDRDVARGHAARAVAAGSHRLGHGDVRQPGSAAALAPRDAGRAR